MNPDYYNQMPNNGYPQMMEMKEVNKGKFFNKRKILILVSVILFIVAIIFFFKNSNKKDNKEDNYPIYGTWSCISGIDSYTGGNEDFFKRADTKVVIKKDHTFEMYDIQDKNTLDVKASLVIEENTKDKEYNKYLLAVTSTDRVVNGQSYTNEYTTKYQLIFTGDAQEEFGMINTITNSLYYCLQDK